MLHTLFEKGLSGEILSTVNISEKGKVTFFIELEGTGTREPFDDLYSGSTSFVITVVPGFDSGMLLYLGIVIVSLLIVIFIAVKISRKSSKL